MKKLKFLIGSMLILLGFIIVGELHHFYLDNFMNGITTTTLYLQRNISEKEMKKEILRSAENNNVDFFVLQTNVKSTFEKDLYIYQSKERIQKYLKREYGIEGKSYKSIFSGVLKVHYNDYGNISDKLLLENHIYYVFGKNDDIQDFKMELINKYAGNHPRFTTKTNGSRNIVIIIWMIIYILLFILTSYDQLFQQKEIYIRAVFGEQIHWIILKNIFLDVICYGGIVVLTYHFLKQFTMVDFHLNISLYVFGVFIFLNSLQYFRWMLLDIKNVLKKGMFSAKVLYVTYVVKCFTIIITNLIIASNVTVIFESLEYASQREFFEKYKDYFYTNLDYKDITGDDGLPIEDFDLIMRKSSEMKEVFYQKYFAQFQPVVLAYFGEEDNYDMIIANRNATEYLFEIFPELKNKVKGEGYYYIIPEKIKNVSAICRSIDLKMENYEDTAVLKNRKIILYTGNKKVLNIDELSSNGSKYSKNPIIVLNTIKPVYNSAIIKPYIFKINYEHDILYKIDEMVFDQFVEEYSLENHFHAVTNAYEKYKYNWVVLKRVLYINLIFSLLVFLLEMIIIKTIINLEFKIHAIDLAIKKVLGFSYFQRYKQIIIISTLGSIICIITGAVIGLYTGVNSTLSIIISGLIIYILDLLVIWFNIEKNERANVSNILKGEYIW